MIIKYVLPCSESATCDALKHDMNLLLSICNSSILFDNIDYNDNTFIGIKIESGKKTIYSFFCEISKLPHSEQESCFLRLTLTAIDVVKLNQKALQEFELPASLSIINKALVLLDFIKEYLLLKHEE